MMMAAIWIKRDQFGGYRSFFWSRRNLLESVSTSAICFFSLSENDYVWTVIVLGLNLSIGSFAPTLSYPAHDPGS
jgi:hypothetical protein